MAYTIDPMELIQGPAFLHIATFGAPEPLDTQVNQAPAASAWSPLGPTDGGVTLNLAQEYAAQMVDQSPYRLGSRLTNVNGGIATSLAAVTLENFRIALNGGTITSGATWKKYVPNIGDTASQPEYRAIMMDGWAPMSADGQTCRRRVIVRKILSTEALATTSGKENKNLLPVTFTMHYVDDTVEPFAFWDELKV